MLVVSISGDVVMLAKLVYREGDKNKRHELLAFKDKEQATQVFADARKTVERYAPFVGWKRLGLTTRNVNIAENGLRTHRVGRSNEPGSMTTGFFGGSTIWGTGVEDDGTIPAIFDEITRDFAVVNYGEGGWTSRQSLAQLINLINQEAAPDIVIFYSGLNDVATHCNQHYGNSFNTHHEAPKIQQLVRDSQSSSYVYRNFLATATDTIKRVTGRNKFEETYACDNDADRAAKVAKTLLLNWEMAHTLVTSYGGQFFAFLQPVAGFGSPKLDYLDLDERLLAQYPPVFSKLQTLIAERGEGWVWDISDAFDGNQPLYMDAGHVTRDGNALIASRIRDTLIASLESKQMDRAARLQGSAPLSRWVSVSAGNE
jgi:lysophospholipase L1-like esterase